MKNPQWEEIKNQLQKSHGVEISTVSAELVEKFRDDLLSDDYKKIDLSETLVLSQTDVETTVCKVTGLYGEIQ